LWTMNLSEEGKNQLDVELKNLIEMTPFRIYKISKFDFYF